MKKKKVGQLKDEWDSFYSDTFWFSLEQKILAHNTSYHWQEYYELEFIVSGEGVHKINGLSVPLKAGSVFLIAPKDMHAVLTDAVNPLTIYNLKFDQALFSSLTFQPIFKEHLPLLAQFSSEDLPLIIPLFLSLKKEYMLKTEHSPAIIASILEHLCLLMVRNELEPPQIIGPIEASSCIGQAVNIINYHFREHISLTTLAKELDLNPNYLGELFTNTIGISFSKYITNLRLSYAHNLLAGSSLSVNEICTESGFSTPSYFIRLFKEKYGITPAQLRRTQKQ